MRVPIGVAVCALALLSTLPATAKPAPGDVAAVWALEGRYWSSVQARDDAAYRSLFHEEFIGWPCGQDTPRPKSWIAVGTLKMGPSSPVLDERSATGSRDFVVVYYRATDQAPQPDGSLKPRVRSFTHTWVRMGASWQVIGGMCREG
jgi:hypothetical protein